MKISNTFCWSTSGIADKNASVSPAFSACLSAEADNLVGSACLSVGCLGCILTISPDWKPPRLPVNLSVVKNDLYRDWKSSSVPAYTVTIVYGASGELFNSSTLSYVSLTGVISDVFIITLGGGIW